MIDMNLTGKRAVVTGASLGIGAAVVRLLADHGADVTFCARNKEAINKLSKVSNFPFVASNIFYKENDLPVFDPYTIVNINNFTFSTR